MRPFAFFVDASEVVASAHANSAIAMNVIVFMVWFADVGRSGVASTLIQSGTGRTSTRFPALCDLLLLTKHFQAALRFPNPPLSRSGTH